MDIVKQKVLQLNAAYQPDSVITMEEAFKLIWKGAAEMVEQRNGQVLRSQYQEFPAPSVIRLIQYIDVFSRRRKSYSKRIRILTRDRLRCAYCRKHFGLNALTIDHIIPSSRGGETSGENLVAACFSCNQKKGDRTPEEAGMKLYNKPSALTFGNILSVLQHQSENHPDWRQYLFLEDSQEAVFG